MKLNKKQKIAGSIVLVVMLIVEFNNDPEYPWSLGLFMTMLTIFGFLMVWLKSE